MAPTLMTTIWPTTLWWIIFWLRWPSSDPYSDGSSSDSDDHHLVHHTLMDHLLTRWPSSDPPHSDGSSSDSNDHHLIQHTLLDHLLTLKTIIQMFWYTSRITHPESYTQNHTPRCSDPRPDCTARLCTHVQHESMHRSMQSFPRVPASHFQPMSRFYRSWVDSHSTFSQKYCFPQP